MQPPPAQVDGLQDFELEQARGVKIQERPYFVELEIELPSGTNTEDYYLGAGSPNRLLRVYGCRIDYTAP